MKIVVEFNSIEEFAAHMKTLEGFEEPAAAPTKFEQAMEAAKAVAAEEATEADVPPFTEEAKMEPPKQEAAQEKPAVALTEDFRVDVRKTLAKLNKQTGKNAAAEIIKAAGYKKLTEVPLEKLPEIMNEAKEALG